MKKLLLILFVASTNCISYSQDIKISIGASKEIDQRIKNVQLFFKNADTNLIKNRISKNADNHLEEQFVQMQKRLPKGTIFIENISRNGKNGFLVVSQIKPFGIPLRITMDKYYLIESISILDNVDPTFSDDYKLDANKIVLPFHLIDGFLLIDGDVNGKKGKFMFDTGTPFGLLLNNHYLDLQKQDVIVTGNANSGQLLDIYCDAVTNIKIGKQVSYDKLLTVPNSDFSFIEQGIEQDFLGFVGFDFFKNYEFTVDYDYQIITLYKMDKDGIVINPYSLSNTVVATLNFTSTNQKQIPLVEMKLGSTSIIARFDTGNQGSLNLNVSTLNSLIQQGIVVKGQQGLSYGVNQEDANKYNINQLSWALTPLVSLNNLNVTESSENTIGLGFQFLKNYFTIWNYKKRTITLLKK